MASGTRAFDAPTAMSILAKIIEGEPEPLVRADLPPALVAIRDRCLRKLPRERYQDGGELCDALRSAALSPTEAPDLETRALPAAPTPHSSRPGGGRRWIGLLSAVILLAAIVGVGLRFLGRETPAEGPTLAVLPFRNLGPADREYVAQGLTEEVTTRLSTLRGLDVVSSTSALRYKDAGRDLREIADELDVQYLLEGKLQWSDDGGIAITCQLVRGDKGTYFWTESFTTPAAKVIGLQSDIAERVAQELDIHLLEPARKALAVRPTEDAQAYDFYLRGNDAASRNYDEKSARRAVEMFSRAVGSDPGFALAYARLSMAESWLYWAGFDVSEDRLAGARAAAERALELDPELPEAHLALGYYYYRGERDYDEALARFERVRESLPNDSALLFALGAVHRRRGDLQAARQEFERAFRLDPRSHVKAWEAGETLRFLREFREADRYYGLALELDPAFVWAFVSRGELQLLGKGNPAEAEEVLAAAPGESGAGTELAWLRVACPIFREDYVRALEVLADQQFDHPAPPLVFRLWIHELIEDREGARTVADTLQKVIRGVVAGDPEEPNAHSILGLSLAVLGRTEEAIQEGKRAVELAGDDALREAEMRFQLAWIHWTLGNRDATYAELRGLLSEPSWLTRDRLRVDPTFRDARGDPGFEELLEDPATTGET
jgi:serine/threonine-protein kinase